MSWRVALTATAVVLVPAGAMAQDAPKVVFGEAPVHPKVGKLIKISAAESTGDDFSWGFEDSDTFKAFGKEAAFLPTAAGKYTFKFTASGVVGGKSKMASGVFVLDVEGGPKPNPTPTPEPTPDPGPDPTPTPPPAPPGPDPLPTPIVAGHLFLTYVADASALASNDANDAALRLQMVAMKRNPTVEAGAKAYDASFRWYQSDEAELTKYNLVSHVTAAGAPCLIVQGPDGKLIGPPLKNPTPEAIVNKLKALRGSK